MKKTYKVKLIKIVAYHIDFSDDFPYHDDKDLSGVKDVIENQRWPNHCLDGIKVTKVQHVDLDMPENLEHELNYSNLPHETYGKYFKGKDPK